MDRERDVEGERQKARRRRKDTTKPKREKRYKERRKADRSGRRIWPVS